MIDYKEVRIGNLVMYEGKEYKIAGISKDYPFLDTIEFGAGVVEWHDLEPIPLTEEWLVKFGFEKTMAWTYAIGLISNLILVYYLGEKGVSIGFKNYSDLPCQYAHQLQNLFFALTNKELQL